MFETETNPHYREERTDTAAPFHREEAVRIGRVVHATMSYGCAPGRMIAHPRGKPDEENGEVYLAIDQPPWKHDLDHEGTYTMWRPLSAGDRPEQWTWHWSRACPYGV